MSEAEMWLSLDNLPGSTPTERVSISLTSQMAEGDRLRFAARITGRIVDHAGSRDDELDIGLTLADLAWLHESTGALLRAVPFRPGLGPLPARETGAHE
jgi:hypothetical protein